MGVDTLLINVFIFLAITLLAVPVARRVGLGQSVGYLLAGIFIGPWGLAVIRDADSVHTALRISTVALLFLVALQATPARIRLLAKDFFSLSMLQFGLTTLLVWFVSLLTGLPWHHALVCGVTLSLSSSALANQAFRDNYPTGSPLTDTGRRLLLSQYLAVIPIFIFFPLLGFEAIVTQGSSWPMVLRSLILVVVFLTCGPYLLRHMFRFIVSLGLDEVFAAFALILVIGTLLLTQLLDVPIELGAILAAVLLTRSEYGSAINIAIRPFRELMVGMFFISVGMTVNFGTFFGKPIQFIVLVVLLVAIKIWVLRNILRFSSVPRTQRIWLATVLSQSGELAFIVIGFAVNYQSITTKIGSELTVIVALSMLTTPLLLHLAERRGLIPAQQQNNSGLETGAVADAQVVIAGYGRIGQVVARLLKQSGYRISIIDHNPESFAQLRQEEFVGFYGDALRPDLLTAAGIDNAAILVVAIDDMERAQELIKRARREYPGMTIVSSATDAFTKDLHISNGADRAYPQTFETALLMGEDILELVGESPLDAQTMTEAFRDAAAMPDPDKKV